MLLLEKRQNKVRNLAYWSVGGNSAQLKVVQRNHIWHLKTIRQLTASSIQVIRYDVHLRCGSQELETSWWLSKSWVNCVCINKTFQPKSVNSRLFSSQKFTNFVAVGQKHIQSPPLVKALEWFPLLWNIRDDNWRKAATSTSVYCCYWRYLRNYWRKNRCCNIEVLVLCEKKT